MRRLLPFAAVLLLSCGPDPAPQAPRKPPPPGTASASASPPPAPTVTNEDLLYLEDITGERALAFARAHDAISEKQLASENGFSALQDKLLAIYGSKERIPFPRMANDSLRNFWTDAEHPRGLWRATTLAEFRKPKPTWTTLLDVDALGKTEAESYVFHGSNCLWPLKKRCLVTLSKGGGDADIMRELDVDKKDFVKDGFTLPAAKSRVAWIDENTLFVATDFGPGSLSESGYPLIVKEWKRGTPLSAAVQVFQAKNPDIEGRCERDFDHDKKRDICTIELDFERNEKYWRRDGKLVKIEKPDDADSDTWDDELLIKLRSDWTTGSPAVTFKKGSFLVTDLEGFMRGERKFQVLFEPTASTSFAAWTGTKTRLYVNTLHDVKNEVLAFSRKPGDHSVTRWTKTPVEEKSRSISVSPYDFDRSDDLWLTVEDFTVPSSLALWNPKTNKREQLKQTPAFFDASNIEAIQHFATSKDGTKIPYTEMRQKGQTGPTPTVLEAYGGFEISLSPRYSATAGAAWVSRGGVYVLANLRGGGEYGPQWHNAALKQNRQRAYDDMAAVAEDLAARGVTSAKQLGILGGSNGGLLTSVMLTQRPELFGAVVSKVPLTDMQRFHKLLAGSSWMSEYGNPDDPADWAAISKYSPLHNVRPNMPYPPMLITTSTKDDRVHPGHARKLVAKLEAFGYSPLYYENIEGGHGGAADVKQRAYVDAMVYTFFATRLGLKPTP